MGACNVCVSIVRFQAGVSDETTACLHFPEIFVALMFDPDPQQELLL